jgi:predicted ATPase
VWHPLGPASGRPSRLPRQSPPAGLRQATTLNDPTGQFKAHTQGVRFYNRGIPDGYGWDRFFGLEPYAELEDANQLYRYDAVLVLDPLDTFEDEHDVVWAQDREIRRVHELIVQGYYDSGYSPVFVPADAPEERLDFICANLRLPRPSRED